MKSAYTITLVAACAFMSVVCYAQTEDRIIHKGNGLYRNNKLDESKKEYQQALKQSPKNPVAHYNLGNARVRSKDYDAAIESYDAAIENGIDSIKEKAYYNKGVAYIQQKKLLESIRAWKDALKIDASDSAARDNLQKALRELQKQQSSSQNDKQQQQKQQQKQQQPKPQPSRLNKKEVEQYLKSLEQHEKMVQDKMNQNRTKSLSQPDKDW